MEWKIFCFEAADHTRAPILWSAAVGFVFVRRCLGRGCNVGGAGKFACQAKKQPQQTVKNLQDIKRRKQAFLLQYSPALLPLMQHQGQRKMHGDNLNVGNQRASEFVLN